MAKTLRLTDAEAAELRARAEAEGTSMQELARKAFRQYVQRHGREALIDRVMDLELPRYSEALRRLGE